MVSVAARMGRVGIRTSARVPNPHSFVWRGSRHLFGAAWIPAKLVDAFAVSCAFYQLALFQQQHKRESKGAGYGG